jgi:hypothetical protein
MKCFFFKMFEMFVIRICNYHLHLFWWSFV